jgi:hypothetical protein
MEVRSRDCRCRALSRHAPTLRFDVRQQPGLRLSSALRRYRVPVHILKDPVDLHRVQGKRYGGGFSAENLAPLRNTTAIGARTRRCAEKPLTKTLAWCTSTTRSSTALHTRKWGLTRYSPSYRVSFERDPVDCRWTNCRATWAGSLGS